MRKLLFLIMVCSCFHGFADEDDDKMANVTADVVETPSGFTVTYKENMENSF